MTEKCCVCGKFISCLSSKSWICIECEELHHDKCSGASGGSRNESDNSGETVIAALIDNKNDADLMVKAPIMLEKIKKIIKESESMLVTGAGLKMLSKTDIIEAYIRNLRDVIE